MYRANSNVNPQREGACSKDVWTIYNMLPENTHFTLEFYRDLEPEEPFDRIAFLKCGNPLEKESVEDHTNEMKRAFHRYGYKDYAKLILIWNRGFGNSVTIKVIV